MSSKSLFSNNVGFLNHYKYTKGLEYSLDGKNYIGEYHTDGNQAYTGPIPSEYSIKLTTYYKDPKVFLYDKIKNFSKLVTAFKKPDPIIFTPTELDYNNGYAIRFFVEKISPVEKYPIEIDSKQATRYNTPEGINAGLYQLINIKWKLVGPANSIFDKNGMLLQLGVYEHNALEVEKALEKIPNLFYIIKNYTEFARFK